MCFFMTRCFGKRQGLETQQFALLQEGRLIFFGLRQINAIGLMNLGRSHQIKVMGAQRHFVFFQTVVL